MTPYERIEKVIRYIEAKRLEQPKLAELASVAGLSEFHFHRLFAKWTGTTPKSFLKFLTHAHAKSLLAGSDVLTASMESGLSGPGRLHDLFITVEGMTPGESKSGGAGLSIEYGFHETPFGPALLAQTERGVCYLGFITDGRDASLRDLRKRWPNARYAQGGTAKTAARIFAGGKVKLHLRGTPFQLKVWEALLRLPEGRAVSYGALAKAVGSPKATRAVGTAVGRNPVAFLIPCHRVLREAGGLGGYHWGAPRKRAILAWEGARHG